MLLVLVYVGVLNLTHVQIHYTPYVKWHSSAHQQRYKVHVSVSCYMVICLIA